ncbi:lysozyme-like protein [Trametes polyzona]|nr:lysozyme-like protein [Trametes polyzona]
MQLSAPFVLILAALGAVEASFHDSNVRSPRHRALARNEPHVARGKTGRCKPRPSSTLVSTPTTTQAPAETHPAPAALNNKEVQKDTNKDTNKDNAKGSDNNNNNNSNNNQGKNSGNSGNKGNNNNNNGGGGSSKPAVNGLIKITESSCGWPGATKDITPTSGPNGSIDWLNCGVNDNGWQPPYVSVNDIVVVDLADALKDPNSPFKACSQFIDTFYEASGAYGLPPILIASIAMQESSCNPETVGGGGEQGLMQITKDKCGGAPGGNCREPHFNIMAGARFLADTLKNNGGSLLPTLGNYNGWQKGLTVGSATQARWSSCCRCQNNLDYLMQVLNGWFLNHSPYTSSPRIGKYFNLDTCQ